MRIKEVAKILYEQFSDGCACNYNGNDEWLPELCDSEECCFGESKDPLFCWKQFLKHYKERNNEPDN